MQTAGDGASSGSDRTRVDYAAEVGDGSGSSLVGATLQWIARTFPEAPPALWPRTSAAGAEELITDHELLRLLERPNKFYTGPLLWMATVTDWNADGNAYWLKLRNRAGSVVELWWAPSWQVEPKGDETSLRDALHLHRRRPRDRPRAV